MPTPDLSHARIVPAYLEEFDALQALLDEIPDEQWSTPTVLPGWDVHATVSHIMGTEHMLLGEQPQTPEAEERADHVHNDIGAFNERWIADWSNDSPDQMRARFREVTERRRTALQAMSEADFAAESWTPVGKDTYGRFQHIRVFDCWLHEQDIRDAVGRPGHETGQAVEVALDEIEGALGFIVGRKAKAPAGSSVTFELTGPTARTTHVVVGDRASVVPELDGEPTVMLRMTTGQYVRLTGGRGPAEDHQDGIEIIGDEELGQRILQSMAFTI